MAADGESGKGRLSGIFWLLVLAAVVYAAWNAGPAYVANFRFRDALEEAARTGVGKNAEQVVRDKLERSIKELELGEYLTLSDCSITREDMSRLVVCNYQREVKFLPGYSRVIQFNNRARQQVF